MEQSSIQKESSRNRAWAVAACLGAVALTEAFAINFMLPLKERVPYFIESSTASGKVEISNDVLEKFVPSEINKIYFIRLFIEDLLTMDASRTKAYLLPEAASFARASAVTQYKEWLDKDRPIERLTDAPLTSRHVENINLNFVPDTDVAIVRFTLVTSDNSETKKENKSMSVKFSLLPKEITEKNPLGFFVTDFNIKDEK